MSLLIEAPPCADHCSDFVFDPVQWPRVQMNEDFLRISKEFNAMRSAVRVPALDPKYKIAVMASKQVYVISLVLLFFFWVLLLTFYFCRTIAWLTCYTGGRMEDFQ